MKITVVSGSRADKGPLTPVAQALGAEWVDLPCNHESPVNLTAAATEYIGTYIDAHAPDLIVLLGDRFEILGAATAAHLKNTPIAHLSGGDITEGSLDNSMRNAITKMAHLHFPTCHKSALKIITMGEESWRVHTVGCPGVDHLLSLDLYSKEKTLKKLGLQQTNAFYLVAYQPATLAANPIGEAKALIAALEKLQLPCVFTTCNPDNYGSAIESLFTKFCLSGRGVIMDMEPKLFLSAMKHCLVMVGNSSSGFYEAPTLNKAFVNIGERQKGRLRAKSVFDCMPNSYDILSTIAKAQKFKGEAVNPYGDGLAARRISEVILQLPVTKETLLTKQENSFWYSAPDDFLFGGVQKVLFEVNEAPVVHGYVHEASNSIN